MFTIYVEDVNEPPTGLTLNPGWVEEEQPAGTQAGTLAAQGDPDGDETHTYTLVSGDGDEDNARFVIEDNILRTAQVLNFEAGEHPFHIRVRTEDSGGLAHEEDRADERMPAGTTVGILASADPDDPEGTGLYRYELTEDCPDNEYFSVSGNTLMTAAVFDYGIRESYTVCVRTRDEQGGELEKELVISIDPHEAPVFRPWWRYYPILDPINEDDRENIGNSVAEILASDSVELDDGFVPPGIAVTQVDNTHGFWQYSTDSGREWKNFTHTMDRKADISKFTRLLPADDIHRIRFMPYPLEEGEISAAFDFLAWDMNTHLPGETADTRYDRGGRTAFSRKALYAEITVLEVIEYVSVNISGTVTDADTSGMVS